MKSLLRLRQKPSRFQQGILLILLLFSLQILLPQTVLAATTVSGKINGNVRWVPENSPYIVNGDIVVAPGATLTIAPGTEVRFRRYHTSYPYTNRGVLRVLGTLRVEGTQENPVYFGLYEEGGIGDWGGIWVDGYWGGKVIMEYAEIEFAQRGIYVSGGSPVVKNSRFSSNFSGIHLERTTDFLLERNIASGNDYGIYLDTSQGTVTKNSIISNSWGLYSFLSHGAAITHNAVKSNTFGIVIDGGREDVIEYNDFSIRQPNDYAVYIIEGKPARINYNNFFYDPEITTTPGQVFWYIWNEDNAGDVNASHNWWDTVNPAVIEAYIMDRRDRSYLGLVNYLPIAQSPISGTADDISAPVVSINNLPPFSPAAGKGEEEPLLAVNYSLSETVKALYAQVRDSHGLMGPKGGVLWSAEWREGELLRDGQHTWSWNGRLESGQVLADGEYQIEMTAEDIEIKGLISSTARARLIIDTIPPVLTIDFPGQNYRLHDNSIRVEGRVQDENLVGGLVLVRARDLGENVRADLDGESWQAVISRLREGPNILEVSAYDGAGNEAAAARTVFYEPVIDLKITTPTNIPSQVIRGTVREAFADEVGRVEIVVNGQPYSTVLSQGEFSTLEPVPLKLGDNDITAAANTTSGAVFGRVTAVIEYDPLYNITVSNQFPQGLQMVSIPMTPFDDDPTAVFGSSLARWSSLEDGTPGYVYSGQDLERVTPYRGYWWKPDTPQRVTVTGKAYAPSKGFQFPLEPGWNQIGCPFLQPVQWEKAKFAADQGRSLSWEEAVKEGWLSRSLWTYREGGYVPANTLEPWSGYWILVRRPLQVIIPPEAVTADDGLLSVKGAGSPVILAGGAVPWGAEAFGGHGAASGMSLGTSSGISWSLQLSAASGESQDRYNYLGVAPGAKSGFDPAYDLEKPPPAEGPIVWLGGSRAGAGFVKTQDGRRRDNITAAALAGTALAADYRSLDEPLIWDIFIENNTAGSDAGEVTLSWMGNWDARVWRLTLMEPGESSTSGAGTQMPLPSFGSITFTLQPREVKHLQIQAVSREGSLSLQGVLPYPNPWNMSGPLKLAYTINQPAVVEARVYDVTGRLVRILPAETKPAGRHYFLWDGRNGRGRIAANGLYFYQVTARPVGGGKSVKAQGRLAILR
ncbi:MAG: hypothetical protein GX063_06240 [Firmicutes bacterium]|nr:hypothetical protein [Bacillota bacterium]